MELKEELWAKHAKLVAEYEALEKQRVQIDLRMQLVMKGIVGILDVIKIFEFGDVTEDVYALSQRIAGPRLADKIRFIISHEAKPRTARQIIDALSKFGVDLGGRP